MITTTVMPPVTPKQKKHKYYPIAHTSCGYCGFIELAPDAVRYWGNLGKTGNLWTY